MKQLPENLLHEGYILIPKALLKRQINDKAPGELEALLQVLIHANYSETTYKIQEIDIVCQRGESVVSLRHWSQLFNWSRSKATLLSKNPGRGHYQDHPAPERNLPHSYQQL